MKPRSFAQMLSVFCASSVKKTLYLSLARSPKPNEPHPRMSLPSRVAGLAVRAADRCADVALAQNDVDHAAYRVSAVDGRRALLQNFDAIDRLQGQRVEVDEVAGAVVSEAIGRHATAVEQNQRRIDAQAAQRDGGRPRSETVCE